ncbi:Alpha-ketoglutarate-dependent dioxygenase alkB 7, mitochondrial [Gryganskiella cystojenkinii]|nr:Alpha-ketoglutarate-dependent dioxygenase alkB 7, mitochondrial [Gryganskiella cystojenkinii]
MSKLRVAGSAACRAALHSRETQTLQPAIAQGLRTPSRNSTAALTRSRFFCSASTIIRSSVPSTCWRKQHSNVFKDSQDKRIGTSRSQTHYDSLHTDASIASTHFDFSHIPAHEQDQILKDFILVPNYLSPQEQHLMIESATRKLKRALGKQVRYEDGHFDGVITRYRECSASDWSGTGVVSYSSSGPNHQPSPLRERVTPSEIMQSIKQEFFPHEWNWVSPHILELEAGRGGIKPHMDHLEASGEVVAGLCLGSDAVMELIHEDEPERSFKVWLPKGAFYFQRGSVRYRYKHGIPIEPADHHFRGRVIPKEKRISVMLRNALDPRLRGDTVSTTSMGRGMGRK